MKSNIGISVVSVFLSAVIALCIFMICKELSLQKEEKAAFIRIAEIVEDLPDSDDGSKVQPEKVKTKSKRNLKALLAENSDCIGWICIPNTNVSYPVMYTPYDPEKYLRKNFYGEYSMSGVPFLDARSSLNSGNLIIYGHNMRNGTMFSDVKNYANADFKNAHPIIEFETADSIYKFNVTDVKITDTTDKKYNEIYSENGRCLMLSTCYGNRRSGRILVTAKEEIQ